MAEPLLCSTKIEQLQNLLGDNFTQIACLFIDKTKDYLSQINVAIDQGNTPQLAQLAHSLKGSSGNIGANKLMDCALGMENLVRENELQQLQHSYREMVEVFEYTRQAMQELID